MEFENLTSTIAQLATGATCAIVTALTIELIFSAIRRTTRRHFIKARKTCRYGHTWSKPFSFKWCGDHYIGHRCLRCPQTTSNRQRMSDGAAYETSEQLRNSGRLGV